MLTHSLISVVIGRQDFAMCEPAPSLPPDPGRSQAPIGLTQGIGYWVSTTRVRASGSNDIKCLAQQDVVTGAHSHLTIGT
jgi:hypothetical protein